MSPIPWTAIVTHGPAVLAAARSLLANQSKKTPDRNQPPDVRLEQLEKASVETARVLQGLAEQMQALALAQQDMRRRMRVALILSITAAAVAVIAAVVAFASP